MACAAGLERVPSQGVHTGSLLFLLDLADDGAFPALEDEGLEKDGLHAQAGVETLTSSFALKLQDDVARLLHALAALGAPRCGCLAVVNGLAGLGHRDVSLRFALGGGTACFNNLRHEFILVQNELEGELLVDVAFREQFEIGHASKAYRKVLAGVPEVFVGPVSKLLPLVQMLCAEMAKSFAAQGLTLPPWRKTQSMLSKWMPAKVRDLKFTRQASGGSGAVLGSLDFSSEASNAEELGPPLAAASPDADTDALQGEFGV